MKKLRTLFAVFTASLMAFSAPAMAEAASSPLLGPVTEARNAAMRQVNARVKAIKNIAETCRTGHYGVAVLTDSEEIRIFIVTKNGKYVKFNVSQSQVLAYALGRDTSVLFKKLCREGYLHKWTDRAEEISGATN